MDVTEMEGVGLIQQDFPWWDVKGKALVTSVPIGNLTIPLIQQAFELPSHAFLGFLKFYRKLIKTLRGPLLLKCENVGTRYVRILVELRDQSERKTLDPEIRPTSAA